MKIKLVEPGWETFTGLFGVVQFEDGVSVEDVSKGEAQHLSALVRIETLEGKDPSVAQEIVDRNNELAALEPVFVSTDEGPAPTPARTYSLADLEEIADKGGIAALRAIGEPLGVKGRSIPEVISRIFEIAGDRVESKPITPEETAAAVAESEAAGADLGDIEADLTAEEAAVEELPGEAAQEPAV